MTTILASAMKKKGIRGTDIARNFGVSEGEVSRWRRGLAYVPQKHRGPLSELVGVPVADLLDGRGIPKLREADSE